MSRLRHASLGLPLALAAIVAVPGARAQTPSGGVEYDPAATPVAAPGASEGTLLSRRSELLGGDLAFKGTVHPRFAGRPVVLQLRQKDATFREIGRAPAAPDGRFRIVWRTDHIGSFTVRAIPLPPATDGVAAASPPTPDRSVTVFRPARATFFGPGLYGQDTACGQELTPRLQGVAHPSLPCGTLVDLYYRGRTARVPVVDRGPFRKGYTWDLTAATAKALRFEMSDTIGAVRVRDTPPPAR